MASTLPLPRISRVAFCRWTWTPRASIFLTNSREPASSICRGIKSRGKLDHMGLQAEIVQGLGRFQAEQAAADHRGSPGIVAVGDDGVEVFDRAIHVDALALDAGDGRNEGGGAGGQHENVVTNFPPLLRIDDSGIAIDPLGPIADEERHAVLFVPIECRNMKLRRIAMGEIIGQVDAVVGVTRLLAESDNLVIEPRIELHQPLDKAVTHHAVADDDDIPAAIWLALGNHAKTTIVETRFAAGRPVRANPHLLKAHTKKLGYRKHYASQPPRDRDCAGL